VAEWARNAARSFNRLAASTAETEATGRWHLASAVGLGLIALVLWAPNPPKKFRAEFDPKKFPAGALTVLRPDRSARIFTTDQWGDFLIWSLYPVQKVFVDGRSDFYGRELEERIADVLMVKVGWDKTLNRYGVNTILVAPDIPLAGVLKESGRWRVVYDDGVALVFRPWDRTAGQSISAADIGGGAGRDREVTKTQTRDQAITEIKSTT